MTMTSAGTKLRTSNDLKVMTGTTRQYLILRESEILAAGGEGTVYLPTQYPDQAAKIYHRASADIAVKLQLMIDSPPDIPDYEEGSIAIAWPEEFLLDSGPPNAARGFLMKRVSGKPVVNYYSPGRRLQTVPGFNYEHLLATARNLARAVEVCHGQRYVIGDLNESNVLVSEISVVSLIDTDSFQVLDRRSGKIYRSPVGKPEYTPPEMQGRRFDSEDRSQDHDLFGLAVIIYQLLMEGSHPFAGMYTGQGDPPQIEKRIAEGHFPHSGTRAVPYRHMPIAPPWQNLHPELRDEFIQCFDIGHDSPETRPTAYEWAQKIEGVMKYLASCGKNPQHRYFNHLPDCPWCVRARLMGGNDPFPFTPRIRAPARPYPKNYNKSGDNNKRRATQKKPRGVGFGFVVNKRNEILLIQRGYGKERGKWSLPGGIQEEGDSLRRTAIKETREETGIRMESMRLYYKGRGNRLEVWRGKHSGGHIKIQHSECLDAKWFQKDMLPNDVNLAFGPTR